MPSKEKAHSNDRVPSKQRLQPPDAQALDAATRQTPPPAPIQRAKVASGLVSPRDVLQLQHTVGNQAVGGLLGGPIQRQPEAEPVEKADITNLRQDMKIEIGNWKEACRAGISQFAHGELKNLIDSLSEVSWESFYKGFLGNIIWAEAVFVPNPLAAFAVSVFGIVISMSPNVPKKGSGDNDIGEIEEQFHGYIEQVYEKLNAQLPSKAVSLLKAHPNISLKEGLKLFLEASFRPGMIKYDPPMINDTAVRQKMRDSAANALALFKELRASQKSIYEPWTQVAMMIAPDWAQRLAIVDSFRLSSGKAKFIRWVPEKDREFAAMIQQQAHGTPVESFEPGHVSPHPDYLSWIKQHGEEER